MSQTTHSLSKGHSGPPTAPRTSRHWKVRGPSGCCLAKERRASHQNLHGLFLSNIKIDDLKQFSVTNKKKTKKIWDGENICSQHCKQREKDRC